MESTTTRSKKHALWGLGALLLTPSILVLPDTFLALWPALVALVLVFFTLPNYGLSFASSWYSIVLKLSFP